MPRVFGSVRTARFEQVLLISGTAVFASIVLYVLYSYIRAGWQLLALSGSGIVVFAGLGLSYVLHVRRRPQRAAYVLLLSLLLFFGAVPLFVAGVSLPVVLCAGALVVLVGADLMPGRWRIWSAMFAGFALWVALVEWLVPLPRYIPGPAGLSTLYISGVCVTFVAGILWHSRLGPMRALNSIRLRLLVTTVLLVVFTGGAISYFSSIVLMHDKQDEALNRLNVVADRKESQIEAWASSMQGALSLLATHVMPQLSIVLAPGAKQAPEHHEAMEHLQLDLGSVHAFGDMYDGAYVSDVEGNMIASSGSVVDGLPPPDPGCMRQRSMTPCLQSPRYNDAFDQVVLVATQPIFDQNRRLLGAVVGYVGTAEIDRIIAAREGLGGTGVAYLIGADGTILTPASPNLNATGQDGLAAGWLRDIGGTLDGHGSGTHFYHDARSEPVVGVHHWLPSLRVMIIAEQDQAEVFQPTSTLLGVHLGIIFILLATALVTGLYLVRSITVPLRRLVTTAEQIAEGRLDLIAQARQGDEIGTLAQAFNNMTARLRKAREQLEERVHQRTEELARANSDLQAENAVRRQAEHVVEVERNKLKVILDAMEDAVYIVNEHNGIEYSNPALERKFGRPAGRKCYEYLYDLTGPCNWCPNEEVWRGISVRREQTLPDGKSYEVFDTRVTNADGTMGKLAIFHDVTARKQAEDEILERNRDLAVLSRRLVDIQESERQYISRELHDEAGQALTSLMLRLGLLERNLQRGAPVADDVADLKLTVEEVLEGLHGLAMDLRPASLDHVGLVAALRQYTERVSDRSGLSVDFSAMGMEGGRLPAALEVALYRIGQEALANVVQHAQATHADVILERRDRWVKVTIEDNGEGFDQAAVAGSGRLGLLGMRERADMVGGHLVIDSAPGIGTTLCAEVPYDGSDPHHG